MNLRQTLRRYLPDRQKPGDLWDDVLGLLLPPTCRVCDRCVREGVDFCPKCDREFRSSERVMQSACRRCGRPGAGGGNHDGSSQDPPIVHPEPVPTEDGISPPQSAATVAGAANLKPCVQDCQICHSQTLHFDSCIALWVYHDLVREAVVASKYGSQVALADALGRRLGHRLLTETVAFSPGFTDSPTVETPFDDSPTSAPALDSPDVITCVPSHFFRRVSRGGGGSRVIASAVYQTVRSQWKQAEFHECLATTRRIEKQAWLGEKERIENIRGAFKTTTPGWRSRKRPFLSGKHVLLIDDVMTTGATANEIAKTLKRDGVRRVTIGVVARATGH
ncbi:ComF family protein [Roseiconus lacunae]|uniref:ComF family protein n=1 Tax=Roseiconus lacunae TaxID=2605694 RepID=UPI001E3E2F42|nr:double zinc ribbon domain-containing protein [Roseiconus lacunae]MCD0460716.1 double zinc ribbon domain-containing protein [Roseiconus lacunae]